MPPRATYRLQFTGAFGFDDAARLVPYLAALGISHLYASPYLKARPGSTHGYDIVDHNALNPELGDPAAFDRLNAALADHGLKQILDFVPNHTGVGGSDNPFWLDLLEWGPDSRYAGWFDIDWSPDRSYLQGKVLVPFLGDQLGAAIEDGKLALRFDREAGTFAVWVSDTHKLPVSPALYGEILGAESLSLERLGDMFTNLDAWRPNERERADELKSDLARLAAHQPDAAAAIEAAVERYRGRLGDRRSWEPLAALIARQFWRPAYFRVAADDINYRRFFNIADLAGLRMEVPAVFDHAHRLVFDLMKRGVVDGLRIDHIDGLLDPKEYLQRLRERAPTSHLGAPFYLVVEKILGEKEELRADWPVDGSTGYDATNQLLGLLIDPAGEVGFTRIYADFTGDTDPLDRILRRSKKGIMDNEMASELASLARAAGQIALQTGRTADFTRNILRRAIRAVVAAFPVYRTYLDFTGTPTASDRAVIAAAITVARSQESAIDPSVFAFLQDLLTGDLVAEPDSGFSPSTVLRFAMRVQQYSGPVMAKGLEDTAFYRYNRFLALNEVGGEPRRFGMTVADFHAFTAARARHWPHAMLGTATHDTKRGEDARARLAVLSEMPEAWAEAVAGWSRLLRGFAARVDSAAAPDRNDEYALYQTLVGTVPPDLLRSTPGDPDGWTTYAERVQGAMQKAMREAKVHTAWAAPDEAYEGGMSRLIETALTSSEGETFRRSFLPFAAEIARFGVDNSLVQTALKLTLPGVPDIYQGAELWDLSMVDPDNRRPVDFAARAAHLSAIRAALAADPARAFGDWMEFWPDGRVKLALIAAILALRRSDPDLFAFGSYEPLAVEGPDADGIIAFRRSHAAKQLVVIAARFPARRAKRSGGVSASLTLPRSAAGWRDALAGRTAADGAIGAIGAMLQVLPVAVLVDH